MLWIPIKYSNINGLVQDYDSNSIGNTLELPQYFAKPSL